MRARGIVVVGALGLGACMGNGPQDAGRAPSRPVSATSETTTVVVYLVDGGKLQDVRRTVPKVPAIGTETLRALLAGPTAAEAGAGLETAIPTDARLLDLDIDGGEATVDLSDAFESGGGTQGQTIRLAQVACTLDQFNTITGVRFAVAGEPVSVRSGGGRVSDEPVTCASYDLVDRAESPGAVGAPSPPAPTTSTIPGTPCTTLGEGDERCGSQPEEPSTVTSRPTEAEPGQEMEVLVTGFQPEAFVVVDLVRQDSSEPVFSFDITTGADGSATQRFLIPGNAIPGAHLLIATSADRTRTASFPVTVLPSSDCPPDQQPEC